MRVHCDVCGIEILKEDAIVVEEAEEICYLCSEACAENKEYHELMADPGRGDSTNPTDTR